MAVYTKEQLKGFGYTHIATHLTGDSKGNKIPVTYDEDSGEYGNGITALLDPEINFKLEKL